MKEDKERGGEGERERGSYRDSEGSFDAAHNEQHKVDPLPCRATWLVHAF